MNIDFEQIKLKPEESEFIAAMRLMREEIAATLRVRPEEVRIIADTRPLLRKEER